jgi:hypothetical protein
MSERKIPVELEPAVTALLKQRKPTRAIADWLRTAHGIKASHMCVHRFAERLRLEAFGVPDIDEELLEAQGEVGAHLRTLSALSEQFGELGERAMEGDAEAGIKPDMKLAGKLFAKQARLITDWLRLLDRHAKSRESAIGRARTARSIADSHIKLFGEDEDKEAAEDREWLSRLNEADRLERALGPKRASAAL